MSLDLKAANSSSIGAASYECGPVKSIGILCPSIRLMVLSEVWYGALSTKMTVLSRHSGSSESSLRTSFLKKMSITLLLEFDYRSDRYTSPSVSRPTNMVILGIIDSFGMELVESFGLHFIFLKSDMPSQV